MITPISPSSTTKISSKKYNTNTTKANQTLPQMKYDSVELSCESKMPKSKSAYLSFASSKEVKINTDKKEVQNTAKYAQKAAKEILKSTQKTIDETFKEFESIEPLKDGKKVIEKYSNDGKTLLSRATLVVYFGIESLTIVNYADKTVIQAADGELDSYYKDFEKFSDDSICAKEKFDFENGELTRYCKDFRADDNEGVYLKIGEEFIFDDENRFDWVKGQRFDNDDNESLDEYIKF